jgi:hypothetical protein
VSVSRRSTLSDSANASSSPSGFDPSPCNADDRSADRRREPQQRARGRRATVSHGGERAEDEKVEGRDL